MPCQNCPKEGATNTSQKVVGAKIWYADGTKKLIPIAGQTKDQILGNLSSLPKNQVQIIMLYYNRFDTQGRTRYRRIIQGNDLYYFAWDNSAPPAQQDWIFGQTDKQSDLLNYINPVQMTGSYTNDTWYKNLNEQAMNDFNVTELGINPEIGTEDV